VEHDEGQAGRRQHMLAPAEQSPRSRSSRN
jgi:hypothetical protein